MFVNKTQVNLKKKVYLWEQNNRDPYINMHSSLNGDTENSKSSYSK